MLLLNLGKDVLQGHEPDLVIAIAGVSKLGPGLLSDFYKSAFCQQLPPPSSEWNDMAMMGALIGAAIVSAREGRS